MNPDPWTDPDPEPGDFDADLVSLAPELVTVQDGDASATLRILVSVEGEDASRLQRIAVAQGKQPGDVVAELLRAADHPAPERRAEPRRQGHRSCDQPVPGYQPSLL